MAPLNSLNHQCQTIFGACRLQQIECGERLGFCYFWLQAPSVTIHGTFPPFKENFNGCR
jgi:hypothetical protein